MKKIRPVALLLLFLIILCSCGSSNEPDGIDSVTYISEISSQPVYHSSEEFDQMGGNTLSVYNEAPYSSSLYVLFMKDAFDSILEKYNASPENVPEMEIILSDGNIITGKEYCETYAKNEFKWLCLILSQYSSYGKTLSDCKQYPSAVDKAQEDYKKNLQLYNDLGVTLSDLILYNVYPDLFYEVFICKYSTEDERSSYEGNLSALMESNVRKISIILLPLYDAASNIRYSATERSEMINLAKHYLNRYNSGESFFSIYSEYRFHQDPSFHDTYNDKPYLFYSISDPFLPKSITEAAEKLEDFDASIVIDDNFVCVLQRLPVNEEKDEEWVLLALELAYDSYLGDEYTKCMNALYETLSIPYDENLLSQLSLENYISVIKRS